MRQADWTRRVKELEERYQEEEKTVIHEMVHAANLTPEQLAEILALAARGNVGIYPEEVHEQDKDRDFAYENESEEHDETY